MTRLRSIRNTFQFTIRNALRFELQARAPTTEDARLLPELEALMNLLPWSQIHSKLKHPKWTIADVGTRNFSLAPIIDKKLVELDVEAEIYGIEIDAYRRLYNFRTRMDYGRYYASKARNAKFLPTDFLKFSEPLDICLMLNPFVTQEPLIRWGLPLKTLQPKKLFHHARRLVKENGVLVISNPNEEEKEISIQLASEVGFSQWSELSWQPTKTTIQKQPRLISLWS